MRTAKSWLDVIDPVAHLGAEGELERQIERIQSDARAELEQRIAELEKDKARLDWLASINNADRLYSLDGGFMITDDYGAGEVYSTIRQAIDVAMKGAK